ncbi:hypothetical protein ACFV4T_35760 [Streptomyces sp. NPDC059755]|uniref:hypothetical protein n=1 Tax=Streptomyces sp. NPDC059755 TaxID=3346934 RepID=UPI003659456C
MGNRLAIIAAAAVLPLTAAASLAAATQAGADPTNPRVVVAGTVGDCDNDNPPTEVQFTVGKEAPSDDSPGVENDGVYKVIFKNIPKKGVKGQAVVTCEDDTYTQKVTITRPANKKPLTIKLAP